MTDQFIAGFLLGGLSVWICAYFISRWEIREESNRAVFFMKLLLNKNKTNETTKEKEKIDEKPIDGGNDKGLGGIFKGL